MAITKPPWGNFFEFSSQNINVFVIVSFLRCHSKTQNNKMGELDVLGHLSFTHIQLAGDWKPVFRKFARKTNIDPPIK